MSKTKENGPVVQFPFGTMKPPAALIKSITSQGTLEAKLLVSRVEIKAEMARFYGAFHKKYPNAGMAAFARQFDASVPQSRDEYRVHKTFMTIDNMFRSMPEVKTGGKPETEAQKTARLAKQKKDRANKAKAAATRSNRAQRLVVAILNQIGLPPALFTIAAQRCGFTNAEIETMLNAKGALLDVGLGHTILALRSTGVAVSVAMAKDNAKAKAATESLPTAAEIASSAKSTPQVQTVSPLKDKPATTRKTYKSKGQYQVTTLKPADNVKASATK